MSSCWNWLVSLVSLFSGDLIPRAAPSRPSPQDTMARCHQDTVTARVANIDVEESDRHHENPFVSLLKLEVDQEIARFTKDIPECVDNIDKDLLMLGNDPHDISVYTGRAGFAWTVLKLAKQNSNPDLAVWAKTILQEAITDNDNSKQNRRAYVSFIGGISGPAVILAKACLEGTALNQPSITHKQIAYSCALDVFDLLGPAIEDTTTDDVLFGRAGYLLGLLSLLSETWNEETTEQLECAARTVVDKILDSGSRYAIAAKLRTSDETFPPLWWQWHDKEYLGAAHGVSGILHALLLARDYLPKSALASHVIPTVKKLMTYQFPSGNFPSSLGSSEKKDKLVQWCHGSPGIIHLLLDAHRLLGQEGGEADYLKAAKLCASTVWHRGLLKKGYSICHGVSGNAYALVKMWQVTGDKIWLDRAWLFAGWCLDMEHPAEHRPDRPTSLFEGMSGRMFMWTDFCDPKTAQFPIMC